MESSSRVGVKRNSNDYSNTTTTSSSSTYLIEDTETQWTSWLVPMFVVANIALFIVVMYLNDCPNRKHTRLVGKCVVTFLGRFSFEPVNVNPLFGPSSSTLKKLGALEWNKVVVNHQGWRLITCIWLHAGVIHLLVNMLSLVFIGIRLEQQFGFVRIGILYLFSGFGGSVLSFYLSETTSPLAPPVLFSDFSAQCSRNLLPVGPYTQTRQWLCSLLWSSLIIVINLAIGILPHVDNFAHIGGFLTGFLLGFVLLPCPQFGWLERRNLPAATRSKSKYKPYQYVLWVVSVVLLVSGFSVAFVMLFRGENGNDHCHWCHYLSCVPTSRWDCNEN